MGSGLRFPSPSAPLSSAGTGGYRICGGHCLNQGLRAVAQALPPGFGSAMAGDGQDGSKLRRRHACGRLQATSGQRAVMLAPLLPAGPNSICGTISSRRAGAGHSFRGPRKRRSGGQVWRTAGGRERTIWKGALPLRYIGAGMFPAAAAALQAAKVQAGRGRPDTKIQGCTLPSGQTDARRKGCNRRRTEHPRSGQSARRQAAGPDADLRPCARVRRS